MTTEVTCVQLLSGFDWEDDWKQEKEKKKEKLQSTVLKIAEFQSMWSLLGSH